VPATRKSVVRTDLWLDSSFEENLSRETDIDLSVCPIKAPAAEAGAMLANAHAFHVSPAKDELPAHLFITPAMLQGCPKLLLVSSAGAGFDTIDVDACTAAGVAVVNQAGGNAVSVAEMAIGLMLDVSRRISECDRRLRRERGFPREDVMGRELNGKTLGVVGIGHTGSRVAALGRAFGMTVLAVDPFLGRDEIVRRGAEPVTHDQLLARADFVSLHCPRDASTMRMIDAAAFARMKPGAIFISTARGGIHDEAALAAALASGHLAGAGLDVWHPEPPSLDNPLLAMDNVVATFHTAGVTHEARRNVASMGATQIIGAFKGERPPRLINPQVWPEYAGRFARIFGIPPAGHSAQP
jgi:D-3-phosphoglycerate dehydrogenase / 2-oxoglutarate reductase